MLLEKSLNTFLILFIVLIGEGIIIFSRAFELNASITYVLQLQLFLLYIIILLSTIRQYGVTNVIVLYYFTLGLFLFMRIFVDLFGGIDFRIADSLIEIELSELIAQKMLWVYALFIVVLFISYSFLCNKAVRNNSEPNLICLTHNVSFLMLGKFLMFSFSVFAFYRIYIEFTYLWGNNFTLLYVGGSSEISIPSFVRVFTIFFQVGYMFVLASVPSKRVFLIFSGLYLATQIPNLFLGLRASFSVTILFMFWYWCTMYNKKVKLWRLLLPVILLLFLLQSVAFSRSNDSFEDRISYSMVIVTFLVSQSQSMYVLPLYMQYKDDILYQTYPYVLDPFLSWLFPDGQSVEVVKQRSSIGHQLVYSLNPDYYLSGASIGTTAIAELYEFGIIGIIVGAIFLGWLIFKFNTSYRKSRVCLFFSMYIVTFLLVSPRSSFFPNLYSFIRISLVALFSFFAYQLLRRILRKRNDLL